MKLPFGNSASWKLCKSSQSGDTEGLQIGIINQSMCMYISYMYVLIIYVCIRYTYVHIYIYLHTYIRSNIDILCAIGMLDLEKEDRQESYYIVI